MVYFFKNRKLAPPSTFFSFLQSRYDQIIIAKIRTLEKSMVRGTVFLCLLMLDLIEGVLFWIEVATIVDGLHINFIKGVTLITKFTVHFQRVMLF